MAYLVQGNPVVIHRRTQYVTQHANPGTDPPDYWTGTYRPQMRISTTLPPKDPSVPPSAGSRKIVSDGL